MSEKPGFDFVIKNTPASEVIKYLEVATQLMNGETGRYNLTIVVNEVSPQRVTGAKSGTDDR